MRYLAVCSLLTLLWCAQASADSVTSNPMIFPGEQGNGYNPALATPWVELQAKVPGLPKDADLKKLSVGGLPAGLDLYADFKHLEESSKDRVIRTWFVLRSREGGYNATYEGIRCSTWEYQIYAYGSRGFGNPVRLVRLPQWHAVPKFSYRDSLMHDYLCHYGLPKTPYEIRNTTPPDSGAYTP